jgi:tetratricopeptide (TPR) repeat protein
MSARALVVALAIGSAACSSAQAKAERYMEAGDAHVADGRYQAAAIEYRNAIKHAPESSVAYRKLGVAQLAAGEAGVAYRAFTKAVDVDPSDVEPRLEAGRLLLRAGMYEVAQVRAEQVLDQDPGNLEAGLLSGRALARLRRVDEAIAQLTLAATTSRDARVYVAIGEVKQQAGDAAGAESAFREAINRDAAAIEARAAFAAFLLNARRVEEAEAQLLEAHAAAPDDELANRALAALYLATDRQDSAEPYLQRAADRPAQKYRSSLALSDFYASLNRFEDAKAALSRVRRAESTDAAAAQIRLAALEYASGAHEEAHRLLKRVLKRRPTSEALALEARFKEAEESQTPEP